MVIVAATAGLLQFVEHRTLRSVIESFNIVVTTGELPPDAFSSVNREINTVQIMVYGIIIVMSIFAGFIVTRLALMPVRESLILQRRFIASVAHELRTPLAILKTQNEVALFEMRPGSPTEELLEQNVTEVDNLTEILNNLLLFSRVDTVESISFNTVRLDDVIETVLARLKDFAERKGITVSFIPTQIPSVYGNETGLEQIFFNLVKNAVNYTHRGGEVVIACTVIKEKEVTIRVSDNGIGIKQEDLAHIFEPFYRTDSAQEVSSGTGLGLALVFEIVKLHNGRIRVQSTPGVGTSFDISIPRKPQGIIERRVSATGVVYDFSHQHGST